jgi:long-chain acyl-CoA synthetase
MDRAMKTLAVKDEGGGTIQVERRVLVRGEDLTSAENNPRIAEAINAEVRRLVSREQGFKPFEFILAWRFAPKPFEVGDELTATFKPKRHVITEKYSTLIDEMYEQTRTVRKM